MLTIDCCARCHSFFVSILRCSNLWSALLRTTEMAGKRGEDALAVLVKRLTSGPIFVDSPVLIYRAFGGLALAADVDVGKCTIVTRQSHVYPYDEPVQFASFRAYFDDVKKRTGQRSKTEHSPYERCELRFQCELSSLCVGGT